MPWGKGLMSCEWAQREAGLTSSVPNWGQGLETRSSFGLWHWMQLAPSSIPPRALMFSQLCTFNKKTAYGSGLHWGHDMNIRIRAMLCKMIKYPRQWVWQRAAQGRVGKEVASALQMESEGSVHAPGIMGLCAALSLCLQDQAWDLVLSRNSKHLQNWIKASNAPFVKASLILSVHLGFLC